LGFAYSLGERVYPVLLFLYSSENRKATKKPPRESPAAAAKKYLKYEMTLDRSDFFPFASSAVKGHFIEFLISNIVVTSLSAYFGALPRQRDHFLQLTAFDRFTILPNVG
jgi:hypothetical protein